MLRPALLAPPALAGLLLVACSGGGDSPATRTEPPRLILSSPANGDSDAAVATFRGSSTVPLAELSWPGATVTTTDGFLHWIAEVPLAEGENRWEVRGRAASGATTAELVVERRRPELLLPAVRNLVADPMSSRLSCVTATLGDDQLGLWGPRLTVQTLDLDQDPVHTRSFPIPVATFTFTPQARLLTTMDLGTRLHFLLQGYLESCICDVSEFVDLSFDGPTLRLPAPGLTSPRARIHTGRADEFATSWPDGFGVSGTDPRTREVWAPADGAFQPGTVTRGLDDSTFFVADLGRARIWQCLRDSATPTVVADDLVGNGPSLGLVTSLAFLPTTGQLLASGGDGLLLVDLASGDRRLLDSTVPDAPVASAMGRVFLLVDEEVQELSLESTNPSRRRLADSRGPEGIDWRGVLAIDHEPGTRNVLLANGSGVHRIDMDTGRAEPVVGLFGLRPPVALDARRERIAFVIDEPGGAAVRVMNFQRETLGDRPTGQPVTTLTFDEDNGRVVYVAQHPSNFLVRQVTTFEPTDPRASIDRDWDLASLPDSICAAGNVVWAAKQSAVNTGVRIEGVFRIDLTTGFAVTVPNPGVSVRFPRRIFLDPVRRRLGVALHGELVTTTLEVGPWERHQGPGLGNGPQILEPIACCAVGGQDSVVVVDRNFGGLFHIDLVTGERTLLAW